MREQRRNYVLAEMEIGSDADEAEYRAALERGDTVRMAELAAECMRRRERAERWMKENGL